MFCGYDTPALQREQSLRKVVFVILTLCTAFLSINIAEAVEDSPSSRATLKGLPGLFVGVPRLSGCENFGVHSQAIGAEVDSQLQEAGVKVLEKGQGPVVLRIIFSCNPLPGTDAVLFFSIVRIDQTILWPNSSNEAIVTSWRSERGIGISHRAKVPEDLRKEIKPESISLLGLG